MDTILVTGAGGFLGRYLCKTLKNNHRVVGVELSGIEPVSHTEWLIMKKENDLGRAVSKILPDIVIHAAFVNRKPSNLTTLGYINNVISTNLPLCEVISKEKAKLLLVSSSAVYGKGLGKTLIDEECPLKPVMLYGLAKTVQEMVAQYYCNMGLMLCIVRLSNLCGPGQGPGMVLSDWVKQVVAIVDGKASELKVRHRSTSRDFVDVRDAARAITFIAEDFPVFEVFNISSGEAVSLMDISQELEKICPVPLKIVETEPDKPPTDIDIQQESYDKIKSRYGWRPEITWRESLKDMWNSFL